MEGTEIMGARWEAHQYRGNHKRNGRKGARKERKEEKHVVPRPCCVEEGERWTHGCMVYSDSSWAAEGTVQPHLRETAGSVLDRCSKVFQPSDSDEFLGFPVHF